MNMRFTTCIFDLDGTVMDSERIYDAADAEFLRRRGIPFDRDKIVHLLMSLNLEEGAALLQKEYGFEGDPKTMAQERREIIKELYGPTLTFIDGFKEFYEELKTQNIKVCVATSSDSAMLPIADKKLHLSELFDGHIYKIEDVGNASKPDPAIFLYAAEKMDASPDQCFVIEDSTNGVAAAKNAGMYCIALTTSLETDKLSQADMIVKSYTDIDLTKLLHEQRNNNHR